MEFQHLPDKYRDLKEFCAFDSDGSMRVLDVVTKEALRPNEIPPSVERDGLCARGLEELSCLGREGLTVPLVMGYHGGAEDFDLQVAQYGDILEAATVVGIEADWQVHSDETERVVGFTPTVTEAPGRREFTTQQLRWLEERSILAVPCDLDGPDDSLRQRLGKLYGVDASWLPEDEAYRVTAAAAMAYNCTRQWIMMGHLGYWIAHLSDQGIDFSGTQVPLMLGSAHVSIAEKFAALGIEAQVNVAAPEPNLRTRTFIDVTKKCRMTSEQLLMLSS